MEDLELPLTAHLDELRTRLFRALLAIGAAFAVCYPNSYWLFDLLEAPLIEAAAAAGIETKIVGTGVAEAFFTRLKVSFIAALFVALPVVLFQVWKFIVPGLRDTEANYARGFVLFGTLFFLAGAYFCYTVVFPFGFPFFLSEYTRIGVEPLVRISEYLSFSSRLLLAFGTTFEMPVAAFFLARAGVITHRTLIGWGRYAIIVLFVAAAILTPPDAASQMLMVVPLLLLYALSIGVAYVFRRNDDTRAGDDEEM